MVERGRQVREAEPRHGPERRFEPDHAAEGGGDANRAAGVGTQRAASTSPAATAALLPLEEPPGTPSALGFSTGPCAQVSLVVK